MDTVKRKRRSDRMHLIYQLTAPTGDSYIGVTYREGSVKKSLQRRWMKHVYRALTENKDWKLCAAIRQWDAETFKVECLELLRGKKPAHIRERALVRERKPTLNTDVRERLSMVPAGGNHNGTFLEG